MKVVSRFGVGLVVVWLLVWAWMFLHVEPIAPTRPYKTCEDRKAWAADRQAGNR